MFEFTHGGLWFNWDALDSASKRLAGWSLVCSGLAGGVLGIAASPTTYALGYRLASGRDPARVPAILPYLPALAWVSLVLLVAGGVLWWRFSVRQDEMFNRVQNWALGMSGAATALVLTGWAILSLAGAAPPVAALPLIVGFWCAVVAFWLVAVRRWA